MKAAIALIFFAYISTLDIAASPVASPSLPTEQSVVPVTLGQSVVALTGPWKFHIGDDPQWADPGINDSGWQTYTLMPGHSILTPEEITESAALPGWQQHGHPGYTGYAWYRLRLQVPEDVHSPALLIPQHVNDAYEVYLNGSKIGAFGRLNGWPLSYRGQPQLISIPAAMLRSRQPVTLALRFWNLRIEAEPDQRNLAGGLRGVPLVGPSALLQVFEQSMQEQMGQRRTSPGETSSRPPWELIALISLYIAVGLISLALFLFSRGYKEYLWAGISLVGFGAMLGLFAIGLLPQTTIPSQLISVTLILTFPSAAFAMPLAAMYLLGVPRARWRRANYLVAPVNLAWCLQLESLNLGLLPPTPATDLVRGVTLWLGELSLGCLLLAIAVDGVRTIGRKAWLPMTPGLLFALYCLTYDLAVSGIFHSFALGEFVCACVPLSVLIIFLMRFTEQQRENGRFVEDMRQAREVQRLMIPERPAEVRWLQIESEYLPAREVGGDFFQIIPVEADGSVLIVAGDVTGHGLQAGMLVALIVGAITTESAHTADPLELLQSLNARLCARGHSQATCLAVRIFAKGTATIASAGHLPPYLNGREISIDGALPLGMVSAPAFSTVDFDFAEADQLFLISDGVVEAQKPGGELFGFERIHQMLATRKSAREVASAAAQFGQEDDITVLSITRVGKLEAVTA